MSGGYPPFNFYSDTNELVGFDVDVAREVAARLGVALKPVTTEWSGIIEGLRSGVYDGILGSMAVTEDRLKVVNFSTPYYYSGAQMMVKRIHPSPRRKTCAAGSWVWSRVPPLPTTRPSSARVRSSSTRTTPRL